MRDLNCGRENDSEGKMVPMEGVVKHQAKREKPLWFLMLRGCAILVSLCFLFLRVRYNHADLFEARVFSFVVWPGVAYFWFHVKELLIRKFMLNSQFVKDTGLAFVIILTVLTLGLLYSFGLPMSVDGLRLP